MAAGRGTADATESVSNQVLINRVWLHLRFGR